VAAANPRAPEVDVWGWCEGMVQKLAEWLVGLVPKIVGREFGLEFWRADRWLAVVG